MLENGAKSSSFLFFFSRIEKLIKKLITDLDLDLSHLVVFPPIVVDFNKRRCFDFFFF